MKKLLLLNAFAIICLTTIAQNYSQIGAIGHYNLRSTVAPNDRSFATLETVKDTIINNFPCKKLVETHFDYNGAVKGRGVHFIQNEGHQVYFFYEDSSLNWVKDTLYNFALTKGDSYTFYQELGMPVTVTIDSVSSMMVNGVSRTVQHLRSSHVGVYLEDKAVEGLGALFFFMPWYDLDPRGGLRCYQDSTIGFYRNMSSDSCDFISVGVKEWEIASSELNIFPNPAKENLYFSFNDPTIAAETIELYTLDGKLVKQLEIKPIENNSYSISINDLKSSLYLLKVRTKDAIYTGRILKQ